MTEPRIEGSMADLKFRSPTRSVPSRSEVSGQFWTGVGIFIAVALAYPFYSYHVQTRLIARDVSAAVTEFTGKMDAVSNEMQRQSDAAVRRSAAQAAAQRQQGVVVAGTTIVGGTRIAIVQLGQASLSEARETICRQSAARFGEPLAGQRLRVQRHRGSQPAVEAGTIVCD